MNNQKGFIGIVILVIIALAAVGGGGYYVYQQQQQNKIATPTSQAPTTETNNSNENRNVVVPPKQEQKIVVTFEDQLSSCTKYKTTFVHPFIKETLQKEILGLVAGKCDYVEQMPNGGKMECKYSESERKAVAQYYRDVAAAESVGTSLNADLGSGKQKTMYTIDGKVVENPLQVAMDNGICVISGY